MPASNVRSFLWITLLLAGFAALAIEVFGSPGNPEVAFPDSMQTPVQESRLSTQLASFAEPEPSWTVISEEIHLELHGHVS